MLLQGYGALYSRPYQTQQFLMDSEQVCPLFFLVFFPLTRLAANGEGTTLPTLFSTRNREGRPSPLVSTQTEGVDAGTKVCPLFFLFFFFDAKRGGETLAVGFGANRGERETWA